MPTPAPLYHAAIGQVPNPLAGNVPCKKHGLSVWAVCDCNPRYFATVYKSYIENDITYEIELDRRDDFPSLRKADNWSKRELRKRSKSL